ncbi:OmpA family protein [Rhodococcus sp. UFZ-B548]|uniref:OmpA family protein n=1 Tax=Rhodococcus sp. UFZ-B548 TaxID=2742212 RepID=UPI0015F68586|nr:OmpA family protein [Rhodococcus sp. UFZ-B548]
MFSRRSSRRSMAAALAFVTVGAASAACGSSSHEQSSSSPTDSVVIVAGTHRNAPMPQLNAETEQVVADAMINLGHVALVRVSGDPDIAPMALKDVTGTDAGRAAIVTGNLTRIGEQLREGSTEDGADNLEAVARARDRLRGDRAEHPVIVFTGSGLSDRGRLDFTSPGMLAADPSEVAGYLEQAGVLPELSGVTVYLVGIGYTTLPQQSLDSAQRTNLVAIWQAVLEASGASVVVSPDPRSGESVDTTATVDTVDVPTITTPAMCSTEEIVFGQQSQVSFVAEANTFIDAGAAERALTPLVDWLTHDRTRTAVVRGTTADDRGDRARLVRLGQSRAETVESFFLSRGVAPTQINSVGVGADFPEYVRPDTDPATGLLLPGPAAMNRSVRIALTDPC